MPSVLITGSNRGIGLELARQYQEAGWQVIATCRQPEAAKNLRKLKNHVDIHALDVRDDAAIKTLAQGLKDRAIDVLINNAGVYGGERQALGATDTKAWLDVFHVNCIGPLHMTEAFSDHVGRSEQRKIVSITSIMGSISDGPVGGYYAYRTSKIGLNMTMANASRELRPLGIAVGLIHPGWVKTDMGGSGALVEVADSAAGIRKVIERLSISNTGSFWDYRGKELDW